MWKYVNVRRLFIFIEQSIDRGTQWVVFEPYCDLTTMTQDDIDHGRLLCVIGVAAVRPAEFVIFRISQKTMEPA
jgi:phage tail sheath protein FI